MVAQLTSIDTHQLKVMHNINLRQSTESDRGFVNHLTERTMSAYVEATWSSLEDRAHYFSMNQFDQAKTRIIQCDGEDVGRITVSYLHDRVVLEAIHIDEVFQGKGIGGYLIKRVIGEAKERRLPLELILLKANPAIRLYERTGFRVYRQDDNRYYMRVAE